MIELTTKEKVAVMDMPEDTEYECNPVDNLTPDKWHKCGHLPWNWEHNIYRPVAPEGYEHTGEFRHPHQTELYLRWDGKEIRPYLGSHNVDRLWILRKTKEPENSEKQDILIDFLVCSRCGRKRSPSFKLCNVCKVENYDEIISIPIDKADKPDKPKEFDFANCTTDSFRCASCGGSLYPLQDGKTGVIVLICPDCHKEPKKDMDITELETVGEGEIEMPSIFHSGKGTVTIREIVDEVVRLADKRMREREDNKL